MIMVAVHAAGVFTAYMGKDVDMVVFMALVVDKVMAYMGNCVDMVMLAA